MYLECEMTGGGNGSREEGGVQDSTQIHALVSGSIPGIEGKDKRRRRRTLEG